MLQIKNISKQYKTGDLIQNALNGVTVNLRDNEFVAILGPSGSGKTTLLNIIGGLDRYDTGDLIINGISTKKYKDRDWDSYRNHTIGFVFQSYFLIPHQTVLSNVELALTISGISKAERRKRATEALEKVGLGDQLHKKPNQMSGGQMQRVAIARALVNNPDILLADEPTGALDTKTSVQVMELLKEVAKDRLVVMVTHNPELAEEYATRIIKVRDGEITDDSNPFVIEDEQEAEHKNMGKSSMSLGTAVSLSFNNLKSKLARTLLTSFAGSIGIIGIALILSLATGVNNYIQDIQEETMTSYPISIEKQTMDLTSFIGGHQGTIADANEEAANREMDKIYSNTRQLEMANTFTNSITTNNLKEFKKFIDDPDCEIHQYTSENGIIYAYDVNFDVYTYDTTDAFINTNQYSEEQSFSTALGSTFSMSSTKNTNFGDMLPGQNDKLISNIVTDNYDVIYGEWPSNYDEVVLVVNQRNEVDLVTLYTLGYLPHEEYEAMTNDFTNAGEIKFENVEFEYEDIVGKEFYIFSDSDKYVENNDGLFDYIGDSKTKLESVKDDAIKIKVVGIIRPTEDAENLTLSAPIAYTYALTKEIMNHNNTSPVVTAQEKTPDTNVMNGMKFDPASDEQKCADAKAFLDSLGVSEKAKMVTEMMNSMYSGNEQMMAQFEEMDETQLAGVFDQYLGDPDDATLLEIYNNLISPGSYDENMTAFGKIDPEEPSSINIYTDTFENKDKISSVIEKYNENASEENKIVYTDYIGLLLSSVTTIIDVISYVLIAFVAVSLVVSSIMIGIITYISVLERTKEIGILRAIGASKKNISLVFNAETFIIGLCSGLLGVIITLLLLIPGNMLIHYIGETTSVNAVLPVVPAIILVVLSILLTLIGGLIPSRKAAKMDPVSALRSE